MPVVLSIDLGTTTITSLALDVATRDVLAVETRLNDARTISSEVPRGRSEWDARRMVEQTLDCLRALVNRLGDRVKSCEALGITAQQHGVVIVDDSLQPLCPFIGWQDQRGTEQFPGSNRTWLAQAQAQLGEDTGRAGCRLATGYMGLTLFWMNEEGRLPQGWACFIGDYLAALLTRASPVTEPTMGASSGLFDVSLRQWDEARIRALGLPVAMFPPVQEVTRPVGTLAGDIATDLGLPAGVPVFPAIGDNQAAFLGCVGDRENSVLVNVGTGGQVSAYTESCVFAPPLETRPFPLKGNLLVDAGLCGGRSYALLEAFFRRVGADLLGVKSESSLFDVMNRLAATAPRGADGLVCEPLFTGTRQDASLRGSWTGIAPENFTPAHLVRSLLEGMGRTFARGVGLIRRATGRHFSQIVGGGNGMRENPMLVGIVAEECGLPVTLPRYREEAAVGAALVLAGHTG